MKKFLYPAALMCIALGSCNGGDKQDAAQEAQLENETLTSCNVKVGGVNFTQAKNAGEKGITVIGDTLKFVAGPQTDYFHSPVAPAQDNSPVIFAEIDNTKPFTFTAKVSPQFTETGTYSAGVLYVYENADHCQKLCFEQDEYGDHRVVSVRTVGTSDDNNHQSIPGGSVYMRLSSDGKHLGSYFSEDGKTWHMARLYGNDFPEKLLLGLSSQSPKDDSHTCYFTEVDLKDQVVDDFRIGKLSNE